MIRPYVSIDIETTGLDPLTCQTIEIGAVIDDFKGPIEGLPTFQCFIDHGMFHGDPYALSMHARIFRAIAERREIGRVLEPEDVSSEFCNWLRDNGIDPWDEKLLVAGKNFASFDRNFLNRLPDWEMETNMKHRIIDPGNMFYRPGIDDGPPSMEECLKRCGMESNVKHEAVEDALDVVRLIRWKRDHVTST